MLTMTLSASLIRPGDVFNNRIILAVKHKNGLVAIFVEPALSGPYVLDRALVREPLDQVTVSRRW
jgi:hypothetical protein